MKCIIFLSSLFLGGQNLSATALNLNDQNISLTSSNRAIDLTEIKLDEIVIDINGKEESGQEELLRIVLAKGVSSNITNPEIKNIFVNILATLKDWEVINFPSRENLPEKNQTYSFELYLMPISSVQYSGLLIIPITFTNIDKNDISNFITNKNIGKIVNIDRNKLSKAVFKVNGIDEEFINRIEITDINYYEATLKGVNGWSGSVNVNFESEINSDWFKSWDSGTLSTKAYSGWDRKSSNWSTTYAPVFGKVNFINYFKNIKIKYYAYSYTGHDGAFLNGVYNTSLNVSSQQKNVIVFNHAYENVNKEYSNAEIGVSWNNDGLLKFDFLVNASAYANWINAYYAYATSRLEVQEITFTNRG